MSGQIGMGFYGASDPTTMADVYKGAWRKDVDALEKSRPLRHSTQFTDLRSSISHTTGTTRLLPSVQSPTSLV